MENKNKLISGLYIVATPIGNLGDITLRALETLKQSDYIICEDTRVTNKLLNNFGFKKSLIVYNDHSSEKDRNKIIELIAGGKILSLVSDAGTPIISDPGYKLIRAVRESGFYITSLPGACAAITALTISALPSDKFIFLGFLPAKSGARKNLLGEYKNISASIIIYETASRIISCLNDIKEIMGDRKIAISRELTKKYEEVIQSKISEINPEKLTDIRGEITIVISGSDPDEKITYDYEGELISLIKKGVSISEAVKIITGKTGIKKKEIYEKALKVLKDEK